MSSYVRNILILVLLPVCGYGQNSFRAGYLRYVCNGPADYTIIAEKYRDLNYVENNLSTGHALYFIDSNGVQQKFDINGEYMLDRDTCLIYNWNGNMCLWPNVSPATYTNATVWNMDVVTTFHSNDFDTLYNDCKLPSVNTAFSYATTPRHFAFDIPQNGLYIAYETAQNNSVFLNMDTTGTNFARYQFAYIPDPDVAGLNSSPELISSRRVHFCLDEYSTRQLEFYDADGDSLSVEFYHLIHHWCFDGAPLCPPTEYTLMPYTPGFSYDSIVPGDPWLTLDPLTFELSCNPTQAGAYLAGIKVNEWRNGQIISSTQLDLPIFVSPCLEIESGFSFESCAGLNLLPVNESINATQYLWDFGIAEGNTSIAEPSVEFPEAGEYEISLIAQPGSCADTSVQVVSVSDPVEVSVEWPDPSCSDGQWIIEPLVIGEYPDGSSFAWTFGAGTPSVSDSPTPGEISYAPLSEATVELYASNGYCEDEYMVNISFPSYPELNIAAQTDPCPGLEYEFSAESNYPGNYLWEFGVEEISSDTSSLESPEYAYPMPGDYLVYLTQMIGVNCMVQDSQLFHIADVPPILWDYTLHVPTSCEPEPVLTAHWQGGGEYDVVWSWDGQPEDPGDVLSVIQPQPGGHELQLEAYYPPCGTSEVLLVPVDVPEFAPYIEDELEIPNVFTPGGDEWNGSFRPHHKREPQETEILFPSYCSEYDLKIFNRQGTSVFDSEKDGFEWDGTTDGSPVSEGTYFYTFRYRLPCMSEEVRYSGYLHLIRE